jgi:hypothetical protein
MTAMRNDPHNETPFLNTRYYQFSAANRQLLAGMSEGEWMVAWSKPATHPNR